MSEQKRVFFYIQLAAMLCALILMYIYQPREVGFWIFSSIENFPQYFAAVALLVAIVYMLLATWWFNDVKLGLQ